MMILYPNFMYICIIVRVFFFLPLLVLCVDDSPGFSIAVLIRLTNCLLRLRWEPSLKRLALTARAFSFTGAWGT